MVEKSERDIIKSSLNEFKEREQIKLGLDGVRLDIDFDGKFEEGHANPKTNTIKVCLSEYLSKKLDCALEKGRKTVLHELRHFWQRKHKKEHVEWWDKHGKYYDDLYADGKEYEYCTIEIDAEEYANGSIAQEYQLDKTEDELETTMKQYYETRRLYEQQKEEERVNAIKKYNEKKRKQNESN